MTGTDKWRSPTTNLRTTNLSLFAKIVSSATCVFSIEGVLIYVSHMMASSNGNIFRVTGHLWGTSPVASDFPAQRPVMRRFDIFFDLRLNKIVSVRGVMIYNRLTHIQFNKLHYGTRPHKCLTDVILGTFCNVVNEELVHWKVHYIFTDIHV